MPDGSPRPAEGFPYTAPTLRDVDRNQVARALFELYLDELPARDVLTHDLQRLAEAALKNIDAKKDDLQKAYEVEQNAENAFDDLLSEILAYHVDPASRARLAAHHARLSQLLELAGHLARENFLDIARIARDEQLRNFDPDHGDPPPVLDFTLLPGFLERLLYKGYEENGHEYVTDGEAPVHFTDVKELVDYLCQPVFAPVLTAHPTNPFTLKAIQAMRAMHDAARETVSTNFAQEAADRLRHAVRNFGQTELPPLDAEGRPRALTPYEETSIALDSMEQMFDGLDEIYGTHERAIERRVGKAYDAELRKKLHFRLEPASWVMGDTDGHKMLRAEHLLHTVIRQRQTILRLYIEGLDKLEEDLAAPHMGAAWKQRFKQALDVLGEEERKIKERRKEGIDINYRQSELDGALQRISTALAFPGETPEATTFVKTVEDFTNFLDSTCDRLVPEQQKKILPLLRKARTFGMNPLKIELRETAEEYARVVAFLLEKDPQGRSFDYFKLTRDGQRIDLYYADGSQKKHPLDARRSALVERFLNGDATLGEAEKENAEKIVRQNQAWYIDTLLREHPDYMSRRAVAFLAEYEDTGSLRAYKDDDPRPIAYHTLKRFQIAAANTDMFADNILAECQGAHNVMEALALQKTAPGLKLHIAPLLEDYESLNNAKSLFSDMLNLKELRRHLANMAVRGIRGVRAFIEIILKLQIAHSDNVRRAGTLAKCASSHFVHRELTQWVKLQQKRIGALLKADGFIPDGWDCEVVVEYFEGGSLGHALRNGVRALSAMVNAYEGAAKYFKLTLQGLDLHNYLSYATAFKRMTMRTFTHAVKKLKQQAESGVSADEDSEIENAVIRAGQRTYDDHRRSHFNDSRNPIGHLLAHPIVNYLVYSIIGNRGSRAAARSGGQEKTVYARDGVTKPIATSKIRTIGYTENLLDANLSPAWFAAEYFENYLSDAFYPGSAALRCLETRVKAAGNGLADEVLVENHRLTSAGLQVLYRYSRAYRESIDFLGYGLLLSDVEKLQKRLLLSEKNGVPITQEIKDYVWNVLPRENAKAACAVLKSFGRSAPEDFISAQELENPDAVTCKKLRFLIRRETPLGRVMDEIAPKERMTRIFVQARDEILETAWKANDRDLTIEELRTLSDAAAGNSIYRHGRVFSADDPHWITSLVNYLKGHGRSSSMPQMAPA